MLEKLDWYFGNVSYKKLIVSIYIFNIFKVVKVQFSF